MELFQDSTDSSFLPIVSTIKGKIMMSRTTKDAVGEQVQNIPEYMQRVS